MTYKQVQKLNSKRNQNRLSVREAVIGLLIIAGLIVAMMIASDGPSDTIQIKGWQGTTTCWPNVCDYSSKI